MNKIELHSIEAFLKENITDKNKAFVFPTDVVAQSWAEWCVLNNHTAVKSVALERFIPWDHFKGTFMAAEKRAYRTIPSLLRKFFVYDIIRQNGEKPFFKKIIRPEFARTAFSFADWIEKNLPSLNMWKKRIEQNRESYGVFDEEDQDYNILYEKYKAFLEENRLFEPAWIETIDFKDKEREFFIFYPEQLADFGDFDEIFAKTQNVTALLLPAETPSPAAYFYKDARRELRQTILRIIDLVKTGKADWTEICLSIPDIDTYRPYIEREFVQYGVPFVLRAGVFLTKNNAGRIFKEIAACHDNDFSYDSVRSLLLDETIPWAEKVSLNMKERNGADNFVDFDLKKLREGLIREGNRMRCLCSYEEPENNAFKKIDIWEEALGKTYNMNIELLKFYRKLKNDINRFYSVENVTFASIHSAWFTFRANYINENDFSSNSNKILSRCITHLEEIMEIEKEYANCGINIQSPFNFYLKYLDSKKYTSQSIESGVSVVPYKLTAGAYFKYQFIIDGSQRSLEVPYKPLGFLNSEKRRKLKLVEDDQLYNTTGTIIKLYARKVDGVPKDFVHFSASEDSFSGFAIPHSVLKILDQAENLDESDFVLNERNWLENIAFGKIPSSEKLCVSPLQMFQINSWLNVSLKKNSDYSAGGKIPENIHYHLVDSKNQSLSAKKITLNEQDSALNKISARGDMEKFFPCPRKWILSQILKLHEDSLETQLMQSYDMGTLHHKILELFIGQYKGKNLPFYDEEKKQFFVKSENDTVLNSCTEITDKIYKSIYGFESENGVGLVENAICHTQNDFHDSPLVIKTLLCHKKQIASTIFDFLKVLLLPFAVEDNNEAEIQSINGIGKCKVEDIEGTYFKNQGDFAYYGKVDCVVESPDLHQLILLDYKNSSSSIPKENVFKVDPETGILEDFQMAVYCRLLSDDCDEELAAAYFYAIKNKTSAPVFDKYMEGSEKKDPQNYAAFEPTVLRCDEYASTLNQIVSSEKMDFVPKSSKSKYDILNVKSYEHCIGCNFKTICRTTYSVAGKEIQSNEE